MATPFANDLDVADIDNDGIADVLALNDVVENVTYVTSTVQDHGQVQQKLTLVHISHGL